MIIDDLKEKIIEQSSQLWGQFQETTFFTNTKEKYDALSPTGQKLSLLGSSLLSLMIILSVPLTYYSSAAGNIEQFESKKNLIRDLFRLTHDTSELPPLPVGVSTSELISRVQSKIDMAHLQPDQIKSIQATDQKLAGVSKNIVQAPVEVSLKSLNLTQIKDIGFELQSLANIKILGMSIEAIQPQTASLHYFNVIYRLSNFSLPPEPVAATTKGGKKK
jgi:hypothetical protein